MFLFKEKIIVMMKIKHMNYFLDLFLVCMRLVCSFN